MIALGYRTPDEWAARVAARPAALLSDHAHCELRAATAAQALITRNPGMSALVERLAAVATEELRHFRRVVRELRRRGKELAHADANPYVEGLLHEAGKTRREPLLDRLLVAGLVERRSLERFELLARGAADERLRELYARLVPSESAHADLFWELAVDAYGERAARRRLDALSAVEAALVRSLPFAYRVHSGAA